MAPAVFDFDGQAGGANAADARASPRLESTQEALGLLRTSRVYAALHGRPYVVPGDVQTLAEPVLAHRVLPSPSFEASGGSVPEAIAEAIAQVPAPPTEHHR